MSRANENAADRGPPRFLYPVSRPDQELEAIADANAEDPGVDVHVGLQGGAAQVGLDVGAQPQLNVIKLESTEGSIERNRKMGKVIPR
jgi:hypothetical protein